MVGNEVVLVYKSKFLFSLQSKLKKIFRLLLHVNWAQMLVLLIRETWETKRTEIGGGSNGLFIVDVGLHRIT